MAVLCGAAKEEPASEEERGGHGFFTRALVEGLAGKASKGRDGVVYLHHLNAHVEDRAKALSGGEQEPTSSIPASLSTVPLSKP